MEYLIFRGRGEFTIHESGIYADHPFRYDQNTQTVTGFTESCCFWGRPQTRVYLWPYLPRLNRLTLQGQVTVNVIPPFSNRGLELTLRDESVLRCQGSFLSTLNVTLSDHAVLHASLETDRLRLVATQHSLVLPGIQVRHRAEQVLVQDQARVHVAAPLNTPCALDRRDAAMLEVHRT